jgi:hypothetical protein
MLPHTAKLGGLPRCRFRQIAQPRRAIPLYERRAAAGVRIRKYSEQHLRYSRCAEGRFFRQASPSLRAGRPCSPPRGRPALPRSAPADLDILWYIFQAYNDEVRWKSYFMLTRS